MSDPTTSSYTPFTLDAIGETTDPIDLRTVSDSIVVTCDLVSGSPTWVFEVSNDDRPTRRYITVATYTVSVVKRLRGAMPRYIRARMTAGSGRVDIAFGLALGAGGKLTEAAEESRANA